MNLGARALLGAAFGAGGACGSSERALWSVGRSGTLRVSFGGLRSADELLCT